MIHLWIKHVLDHAAAAFEVTRARAGHRRAEEAKEQRISPARSEARQEERGHGRADGGARPAKKRTWGTLKGSWVPHDTRDEVVDFVNHWTERTELPAKRLLGWLGWPRASSTTGEALRQGQRAQRAWFPRDDWLAAWEKQAIVDFHDRHPLEGYRRLTFMMLDADVVAVSPSSVYRVLKQAGRLDRKWQKPSKKGTGFVQPLAAHEHWHVDVSYLNVAGTFYYLTSSSTATAARSSTGRFARA